MHASSLLTRRAWLAACVVALAALPRRLRGEGWAADVKHPTPRPGITGAKVATHEALNGDADLIALFDAVRAIPHVADGIRCNCGCADLEGYYSLLTCYEGAEAMARICPICQGEGRVAVRMAKAGRTLAEIRTAIDAQFG